MDAFKGQIVHPQTWPDDIELKGKKVVMIGSGATAATVLPAIADDCEHVTLLQRSPTYFIPGRNENELANLLRELKRRDGKYGLETMCIGGGQGIAAVFERA